jgi:hypothetical protein
MALSESFLAFLVTTAATVLISLSAIIYKSKCSELCYGCCKRDIEAEERVDEMALQLRGTNNV